MAKLFVSYSRKDSAAARIIIQALKDLNQDIWVDWEDIPPASDWLDQILQGIESVDAFIFLVSPDSIISEVCKVEVGHAAKNNKRIIPVVLRQVQPADTIDTIRKLNWIFARAEDDHNESIAKIKVAIEVDFDWVEEHSRLQLRALEWDRGKDSSLLLRGRDLRTARQIVLRAEGKDPKPSDLQKTYLLYSRRNEEGIWLIRIIAGIAIVALTILSYLAIAQSRLATKNATEANIQRQKAEEYAAEADANAKQADANARRAIKEKQAAEKARQRAEDSKNLAAAQRSAARAQIYQFRPGELYTSTLLAIDSWQTHPSTEAEEILRENISLLPIPVAQSVRPARINSIAFNSTGSVFAAASSDGTVCAWQVSDGSNLFCANSSGAVNDAIFTHNDRLILTSDSKGDFQIINAENGTVENQIQFSSPLRDVDVRRDDRFAAVTGDDGKISLIDLNTRSKAGIDLQGTNIRFASFSPNGQLIATGSADGVVSIWSLDQQNNIINTRKHRGAILALKFNPNGRVLVTGGADGSAVVIEARTGRELYRVLHDDQVRDIAFSPDGNWFVTVSNDRKIRIWDTDIGNLKLIMSQSNFVQAVQVSANGQWIATTGDDQTVRVWSASTGTQLFQIPIKGKGIALGFSADGKHLVSGDQNGYTNIWDISSIPTPAYYLQFDGVTTSALYSLPGNWIAASDDRQTWLLNPKSLSNLATSPPGSPLPPLRSNISQIVISPKERWTAVLTSGNELAIYNTQSRGGKSLKPDHEVQGLAFSPDETQLFTADSAGNLQVWDTATGRLIDTPIAGGYRITSLAASLNYLALGMDDEVRVLDIKTLAEVTRLAESGDHGVLTFSADGSLLAAGNASGQIQIWKQTAGNFTPAKSISKEPAASLAFSPQNSLLAVGALDNAYLIDLATGEEFARIPHTGTVSSVSFSSDGSILLTASLKALQFWEIAKIQGINQKNLVETACNRLVENFSQSAWNTLFEGEEYRLLCPNLPVP